MPELPEVETTLKGIKPHIQDHKMVDVIVRHYGLRWPIPSNIIQLLKNQVITKLSRRGKYLLLTTPTGTIILHLGMSGSVRILAQGQSAKKHDHIDILFDNHKLLRFTDPRRFGAFLWTENDPFEHELLRNLGPEPLSKDLTGQYLLDRAKNRKIALKSFIMDSKIVVGVGNIYATEALFKAKIHPEAKAGKITLARYNLLVTAIKDILQAAIKQGGTSLKDFVHGEGKLGYFKQHLKVYGRGGQPCLQCGKTLKEIRLGQRSTVYCVGCQKK